ARVSEISETARGCLQNLNLMPIDEIHRSIERETPLQPLALQAEFVVHGRIGFEGLMAGGVVEIGSAGSKAARDARINHPLRVEAISGREGIGSRVLRVGGGFSGCSRNEARLCDENILLVVAIADPGRNIEPTAKIERDVSESGVLLVVL